MMQSSAQSAESQASGQDIPLVVDLDGTLIRSDLLIESFFQRAGADWKSLASLLPTFFAGKARFKDAIAGSTVIDATLLPYNQEILDRIRDEANSGRPVYLASASNERYVQAVAEHLAFFTGWFASNSVLNLAGTNKAQRLVAEFGEGGFDYIGNDRADLAIWAVARHSIAVGETSGKTRRRLQRISPSHEVLSRGGSNWKAWVRLLRVHQYAKNGLALVPLITSHSFDASSVINALGAVIAFSLCASCVYIFNDLVDLAADRGHPTKRTRPLASGAIPHLGAIALAIFLFVAGIATAALVSPAFLVVLATYFLLTSAYSFALKRKMLVDVVMLAMLYTIRVVGGAAAIDVAMSEWLLAFSMFIFVSLALIKRYTELSVRLDQSLPDPSNRNYRISDLPIVASLAAASGFNAITVFTLYISSDAVQSMYSRPLALWLIPPILMYWIGRVLMLAHRRMMDDDPVVFALKDWRSRVCVLAVAVIIIGAATL